MGIASQIKSADPSLTGGQTASEASQDVSAQLSALKADFAGLASAIQSLAGAGTDAAKDQARAKIAAASERGEELAHRAQEKANQGTAAIADYAREKPFVALAAAAGAGLLIGFLTAPRK